MDAVLLANLGTPDEPTAPALRRYLAEFLGDRRVVPLPRWIWLPILHGFVLRTRPAESARKYARIWLPEGSPLAVHTERQAKLLRGLLGESGRKDIPVAWGMRYGKPSLAAALDYLVQQGADRVVVVPLYPQFSGSTTASVYDAVGAWRKGHSEIAVAEVREYHRHPAYIAALAATVRESWERRGRADKLVMSFHGLPKSSVAAGDPYAGHCEHTALLLAEALGLPADAWTLTYQSRFGRAEWLQPYTQATLEGFARDGVRSVDVICPGFATDCLETLEEIAMECRDAFLAAGGAEFNYIPCLNERADWIAALKDIALSHLAG